MHEKWIPLFVTLICVMPVFIIWLFFYEFENFFAKIFQIESLFFVLFHVVILLS